MAGCRWAGVWPLAPSLDAVGPMAVTVDGLVTGMALLEPGFTPARAPARRIGRLRTAERPEIEQAADEALRSVPGGWLAARPPAGKSGP